MDLPLVTLRQKVATIQRRKYLQMREENSRTSWLARQIAVFIAQGYMVEDNQPALDAAQALAFDDVEAAALDDLSKAPQAPVEPKQGSFEKLMRTFAQKKE